jgi:hypothetical protein
VKKGKCLGKICSEDGLFLELFSFHMRSIYFFLKETKTFPGESEMIASLITRQKGRS